jgi:bifunctional UDP-N-acetylglucosamine pyrophosphorylase/glucosamine-1-phosphate N-acetyltransferase
MPVNNRKFLSQGAVVHVMESHAKDKQQTASLILAAGRGSRMTGFEGNKTLLPLVPTGSPFEGDQPILLHILNRLPPGPKAVVVNHRKEDVIRFTRSLGLSYFEQPLLNGTGGALIAAREFLENLDCDRFIVTMGDVPLVMRDTYLKLVDGLRDHTLMILGFHPFDKKQYGVLQMDGINVMRIIEWKYWKDYSQERQSRLKICNSGIYAAGRTDLLHYLGILEKRPHTVIKERDGKMVEIEEYFITDLVELMVADGLKAGCVVIEDENEVMGVDDLPSLIKAQDIFRMTTGVVRQE